MGHYWLVWPTIDDLPWFKNTPNPNPWKARIQQSNVGWLCWPAVIIFQMTEANIYWTSLTIYLFTTFDGCSIQNRCHLSQSLNVSEDNWEPWLVSSIQVPWRKLLFGALNTVPGEVTKWAMRHATEGRNSFSNEINEQTNKTDANMHQHNGVSIEYGT